MASSFRISYVTLYSLHFLPPNDLGLRGQSHFLYVSNTGLPVLRDKKMIFKLQTVHIRKCLVLNKSCLDEEFNDPPLLLQEVPHQNVNQKCKV